MNKTYICIDIKSFFASVECVERQLDPFSTNLVVADETRGKGTICLAISPKMKMFGINNRCRLFEIPSNIKYIVAKPRMSKYIEYAARIYSIYLKYVAKEDIHVYSIDEAFLDVTDYLNTYKKDGIELAKTILKDIYTSYGITATAGIGTNLYLAKIALDIISKHNILNIGYLNEEIYKKELWYYEPISDFWQIGRGIERRLKKLRIKNMYDITRTNPKILYKEFGINAELLIDHAWGRESCTISDIKQYKPKSNSISTNQVLFKDYTWDKARLVLKEMVELKSLELVQKNLVTDTLTLYIGYSKNIIKPSGGTYKMSLKTNTFTELLKGFMRLYDKTTNMFTPIRRIGIGFEKLEEEKYIQMDFFIDRKKIEKERKIEGAISQIKSEYGNNAILKGMNLEYDATTRLRNTLIGGHNAK